MFTTTRDVILPAASESAKRGASTADAVLRLLEGDVADVPVVHVEGHEDLGRLFDFSIDIAVSRETDGAYREDTFVGERAALAFISPSRQARVFCGVVAEGGYLGSGHSHSFYRLRLVPPEWLLTQVRNCRIFQQKSTPEIIRKVLEDRGLRNSAVHFATGSTYGPRDYCVQYGESDWDFISRLMEEEGLYHFHRERDGEAVFHVTDGPYGHFDAAGGLDAAFRPVLATPEPETIREFRFVRRIRPGRMAQTDYAAVRPGLPLDTHALASETKSVEPSLEVFHFPGEYRDKSLGQRLSSVRLEELRLGHVEATGRSDRVDFAVGSRFALTDHPVARYNRVYLLTRVSHHCVTPMAEPLGFAEVYGGLTSLRPSYSNEFEAIPAEQAFRLPRTTRSPRMPGPQTAVVVGPEGEEIHTDEHGRVKVRFRWDREAQLHHDARKASDSTCWIRVSQPWAGGGYGGLTIPRIGQEVVVDFLDGDPDQPIITGRVYNGDSMPPQSLPANKVRSTIRSNTHKGKGFNEITMDDTTGQEHFYMKSQYDKTEEVGNNRSASVGVDSTEVVGNNKTESVGNNQSTDVTNAYNINCDTMMINAKTSITLQCGAARIHMNQAGFISITGTVITSAATVNNSMVAPMTEVVGAVMLTQAGAVVLIEGGATHVRGEVLAALKGAEVNVVAGGDNVIQGGKVKLN